MKVENIELIIRPAKEDDFPYIEHIGSRIWEGNDYLPRVWDRWLHDPNGEMVVAELKGQVVGVGRLTDMGDGEWWLEGLRVDPDFQGKGIGKRLHKYLVERFRARGGTVLRFMTASHNTPVHRMAAESGFTHLYSLIPYAADSEPGQIEPLRRLEMGDADTAWAFLQGSPHFHKVHGLYGGGWRLRKLTLNHLTEDISSGLAYGWYNSGGEMIGLAIISLPEREPDKPFRMRTAYLDVPEAELSGAASGLRALAHKLGREAVTIQALPEWTPALERAGYERPFEFEGWVFELVTA